MNKIKSNAKNNLQRSEKDYVEQLSVSDLTDLLHGEDRKDIMRKGFYTRRHYSFI